MAASPVSDITAPKMTQSDASEGCASWIGSQTRFVASVPPGSSLGPRKQCLGSFRRIIETSCPMCCHASMSSGLFLHDVGEEWHRGGTATKLCSKCLRINPGTHFSQVNCAVGQVISRFPFGTKSGSTWITQMAAASEKHDGAAAQMVLYKHVHTVSEKEHFAIPLYIW